jgi:hypothetical protein
MGTPASFRLAFRHEGEWVNCYFAQTTTMDGAILLGTLKHRALDAAPGSFEAWQEVMQLVLTGLMQNVAGVDVEHFIKEPAPAHERAGNA